MKFNFKSWIFKQILRFNLFYLKSLEKGLGVVVFA